MSNEKMTIEKWLNDVYYDEFGQYLWAKDENDLIQMIGEVRGWGAIQHCFTHEKDARKFQDEVGKFIAEAINEKLERERIQGGNNE